MKHIVIAALGLLLLSACKKDVKQAPFIPPVVLSEHGEEQASTYRIPIDSVAAIPPIGSVSWGCTTTPSGQPTCKCYQMQGIDYYAGMLIFNETAEINCSFYSPYAEAWGGSKYGNGSNPYFFYPWGGQ